MYRFKTGISKYDAIFDEFEKYWRAHPFTIDTVERVFDSSLQQLNSVTVEKYRYYLTDDKKNYVVEYDLPGAKHEDLKVKLLDNGFVEISGTWRKQKISSSVKPPAPYSTKDMHAKLEYGVLKLTFNRLEATTTCDITIE